MERYVCIHGHFYQPPRENPWLEAIELQDSAFPHHDWNERILEECYAPNRHSRILDGEGRIAGIVNNFERISFNFGPTLLSWLAEKAPDVYLGILEADRRSLERFSGHGSAIAQAYNHMILPLANSRDKRTQVVWGVRDFELRFGRRPEGMWIPETAVDLESLEALAKEGIRFTILAPRQARRVRRKGSRTWIDVDGSRVDPSTAYELRLPSGRRIALFFYDGPVSQAIAFEGLLSSGDRLVDRILEGFSDSRPWPQIVHLATDGETYGHHQAHGEMALSYAIRRIEKDGLATVTNYGEFLSRHPPQFEVEIHENSSWSCVHGIERWRGDCGCDSGGRPSWNQAWRGPLRAALDGLRDALAVHFEEAGGKLFRNPWAARDEYIDVLLDRSPECRGRFLRKHLRRDPAGNREIAALKLLEIQRHAMLMYTSCGWFFDEISGIETVQVLRYAGRAIQLAREWLGEGVETRFLEALREARSNLPEHGDGERIYGEFVRPATVDLEKVGAHYAVSSLFENYGDRSRVFCYDVEREDFRMLRSGRVRLAIGRVRIESAITRESGRVTFGVLHLGDHNVVGGVRAFRGDEAYEALVGEVGEAFRTADIPEAVRAVDRNFGDGIYSLKFLFRDEQRRVLDMILEKPIEDAESGCLQVHDQHAPLMRFLSALGHAPPVPFRRVAQVALDAELRKAFAAEEPDPERIRALLSEAEAARIAPDATSLARTMKATLERIAGALGSDPADPERMRRLDSIVGVAVGLPFEVNLWGTQNGFFDLLKESAPGFRTRSDAGDPVAAEWLRLAESVAGRLGVRWEVGSP